MTVWLDEIKKRAASIHGCLRIDFDSEDAVKWTARVASWPFIQGCAKGYTLEQACERAVVRYDRQDAESRKHAVSIDDLRNI